jgi:outer membrane receptor protein involved in Fe transport
MDAQYSMNFAWGHNRVSGAQKTSNDPANWDFATVLRGYEDTFNQVDVSLDWQFIKRGLVSAGVRNARDKHFQYADIDRLNPRFSNGRLAYIKARFTW